MYVTEESQIKVDLNHFLIFLFNKEKKHTFHKNIKHINIDNNQWCFLSSKSAC